MSYDMPRAKRVVSDWIEDQEHILREQTGDQSYESPEALLKDTAETYADLEAMKGLHQQLERDCE